MYMKLLHCSSSQHTCTSALYACTCLPVYVSICYVTLFLSCKCLLYVEAWFRFVLMWLFLPPVCFMHVPPASCWRHWCVTVCGCAFVVTWWRHRKWQVVVRSRTHPRWSKWCALIPWCELRWRSRCVTYDIWRQVQRNRSFMLLKCMYIIVTVIRFPHIPKIMFSTRFITNFFFVHIHIHV